MNKGLQQDFKINKDKINQWLDELNEDRQKIFNDIKNTKNTDRMKESKLKSIEYIQRQLISYKQLLTKEEDKKTNDF